jgi:hypothetical protein
MKAEVSEKMVSWWRWAFWVLLKLQIARDKVKEEVVFTGVLGQPQRPLCEEP